MTHFDQASYWRDRVSGKMGLGAVGHRALGAEYNRWIYQRRVDVLNGLPGATLKVDADTTVLDLGCGSGFYESYWQSRGIRHLTGIDISAENVMALRLAFPAYRFVEADLTAGASSGVGLHDIVTLFDVLYHLVDDAAAGRALSFAAAHMTENGYLLIFDQLAKHDYALRRHVKFRGRDHFAKMLQDQRLTIEREIPLFVLLEPPISGNRLADLLVAGLYYTAGLLFRAIPPVGALAGRTAYALDRVLMKRGVETQNHRLYVVRKSR